MSGYTAPGDGPRAAARRLRAEVTRLVGLRTDAPVGRALGTGVRPRWLHHGSSISHGASADSPPGIWPAIAARRAGLGLVTLGFSGNAVLDPDTARAIRDQPANLITLELGINVVDHDCFRRRSFAPAVDGFLDTIRDGHATTPIVVVSPILCPKVEDRPGPTSLDPGSPDDAPVPRTAGRPEEVAASKPSLGAIRRILADVVARRAATDPHLTYLAVGSCSARTSGPRCPCPTGCTPMRRVSGTSGSGSPSCCRGWCPGWSGDPCPHPRPPRADPSRAGEVTVRRMAGTRPRPRNRWAGRRGDVHAGRPWHETLALGVQRPRPSVHRRGRWV